MVELVQPHATDEDGIPLSSSEVPPNRGVVMGPSHWTARWSRVNVHLRPTQHIFGIISQRQLVTPFHAINRVHMEEGDVRVGHNFNKGIAELSRDAVANECHMRCNSRRGVASDGPPHD